MEGEKGEYAVGGAKCELDRDQLSISFCFGIDAIRSMKIN